MPPQPMKRVPLLLDCFDAGLIELALSQKLEKEQACLAILKRSGYAALTDKEVHLLPATLQGATPTELVEQIDPWITLIQHTEWLLQKVRDIKAETMPKEPTCARKINGEENPQVGS